MKKVLKKYGIGIVAAFAAASLISCDDKEEIQQKLNQDPVITLGNNNQTEYSDSVKISLKSPKPYLDLKLMMSDVNSNLKSVTYNVTVGSVKITNNGSNLANPIPIDNKELNLRIEPLQIGINRIELNAEDKDGGTARAKINLTGFKNISPTAILPISLSKDNSIQNAGLHYQIDASKSIDGDSKFGGSISRYEYVVDGKTILSSKSKLGYIFSSAGQYTIKLRVQDNDGDWSSQVTKTYSIN